MKIIITKKGKIKMNQNNLVGAIFLRFASRFLCRRKAFTLAEVLITLGIIGVVSALTLPVLVQNYNESKTINILKQSQSILGQALEMAINENGDLSNWGIKHVYSTKESDSIIIAEKLKPFLKLMDDCGTFDSNGKCCPNVTYKYLNGNNHQAFNTHKHYYKVRLANGASIWWRASNTNEISAIQERRVVFFIDTNSNAKPNSWGKDLFALYADNYSIRPVGGKNDPEAGSCVKNLSGTGCAYYVLTKNKMDYLH